MAEETIKKYELNTIINNIPECILFTDYKGTLISFNRKAIEDFFRNTDDKLEIGKSIFDYFEEPGKTILKNKWNSIKNHEGVIQYLHEFKTNTGQIVFFKFSLALIYKEANIEQVCITGRDITKDKETEEKLIKAENNYKNLLDNNPLSLFIYDLESYRFLEVSKAAIELYGYSREEFLTMQVHDLINKEQIEDLRKELNNLKDNNSFSCTQWQNLKKNGELIYIEISAVPFVFNNKNARLALVNDITQSKIAEEKVKRNEAILTRAQEVAKVGIWETDLQTLEVSWSEETFRIFEIDPLQFTDDHPGFLNFVHPDDREKVETAFTESLQKQSVSSIEHRIISGKGSIKIIEERWEIIRDKNGHPTIAIGTCQDITVRKTAEQTLIESERKYRSLTESSMDAILLTIPTGEILSANSAACKLFGLTEEEICEGGRNKLLDVTDPQLNKLLDHRSRYGSAKGELTFIHKDGRRFPGEVSSTIFTDEYGKQKTSLIIRDISERKKIETAYLNSLQEKNTILETIGDGFFAVDNNWKVTYWNHHAEESLGKLKEEMIGQHLWKLFPNSINTESYKKYHQAFETNRMVHFEDYHSPLNKWYDVSAYPLNNHLSVFFKDITHRKKIEQEISESEEIRRLVIDSAMDAIVCINTLGIITVWNPQAEKIFGWGKNEMLGKLLTETIIPPQHRENHIKGMQRYQKMGEGPILRRTLEITAINKQGKEFPIELSITPIRQKDTEIFCAFIRDITDRKLAANLLNEMHQNLQKQAKGLVVSNEELERYAYVASHDLQEPLRMIINFLQLLQQKYDDDLDETARKYINFAVDGANRMKILIMDLLEFSKISTSKQPHVPINLNDIINEVRFFLRSAIEESNTEINVQFLPLAYGNKSQLLQLFQNLISNSIKYKGNQKPIIEIGYKEEPDEWQIYVKDNGIGIDPKFFEKIFIIFQRLHSRDEYSGTGIGLALCKKIVEMHGGKIWVQSAKGSGSTFFFTLNKLTPPSNTNPDLSAEKIKITVN